MGVVKARMPASQKNETYENILHFELADTLMDLTPPPALGADPAADPAADADPILCAPWRAAQAGLPDGRRKVVTRITCARCSCFIANDGTWACSHECGLAVVLLLINVHRRNGSGKDDDIWTVTARRCGWLRPGRASDENAECSSAHASIRHRPARFGPARRAIVMGSTSVMTAYDDTGGGPMEWCIPAPEVMSMRFEDGNAEQHKQLWALLDRDLLEDAEEQYALRRRGSLGAPMIISVQSMMMRVFPPPIFAKADGMVWSTSARVVQGDPRSSSVCM
mmetsp:Transcript_9745/g.26479  ORF Transcript_9745/g.26479 Transcript_9745/m.26479 type:complete len:280 (-) Transcript_9745:923-1762(-)